MTNRIDEILEAAHELSQAGLSPGTTGNVSCRVDGVIYMSASGTSLGTLTAEKLTRFDNDGQHGPKPTKEFPLHMKFYEMNPGAECVIHLHSPAAAAASCLPAWSDYSALAPVSPYFVMKIGNMPLVPYQHPGSSTQADSLSSIQFPFDSVLLQAHGPITSGTVSEAFERSFEIETTSKLNLQLAGLTHYMLDDQQCHELAKAQGRPWSTTDYRR